MATIISTEVVAEYESSSRPGAFYKVQRNTDSDRHVYLSCNCKAWTTSASNRGKQAWQRECKHTRQAAADGGRPAAARPARKSKAASNRFDALEL